MNIRRLKSRENLFKALIVFSVGCIFSGVLTWSSYVVNINSIRTAEDQIVKDILFTLSANIETTLDNVFMPDLIGYTNGKIPGELFTDLTNPSLELSSTSFSWIPRVKASERQSFIRNNSIEYPGLEIKFVNEKSETFPRPINDEDMWPILHANPLFNEDLRGLDTKLIIPDDINRMLSTKETVIGGLFFLASFDNVLKFSNENSVYNILQPVFNQKNHIIGSFNRIFFPSELILNSLAGSSISEVENHQVSIFRTSIVGIKETVFVEDRNTLSDEFSPEIDFKDGKNKYTHENEIRGNLIEITLTSDTAPEFWTYGITMCVCLIATILTSIMYYYQLVISGRNKGLAIDTQKALDIAIVESEHKTRFVSEMSHEFRTPLNGITGMMDLIRAEGTSSMVVRRYMSIAETCSSIMLGLVNDILDFSKIRSGNMTIVRCPVSIRKFIGETMNIMRVTYHKKVRASHEKVILKLEIKSSVPEGLSEIDDTRVRQIIVNLVSNAFKFTHNGTITVKVWCTNVNTHDMESNLHVSVSDTGIGISPEGLSNLFQPFSQVHDQKEIKAGGTGLGLVISKNLCKAMGGEILCESVRGVGTVFSFNCTFKKPENPVYTLDTIREWDLSEPIEIKEDEEEDYVVDIFPKPTAEKIGSCFTSRSLISKKPSIIFADDINVNRLILGRMLTPLHIDVCFAENGLELVKKCLEKKYSLIFSDNIMPIMGGNEASRIISSGTGPNKDTPIIMVSGSNDECGMTCDRLNKPVARHLLYDKMAKWLSDEEVTWINHNFVRDQ